MLFHRAYIGIVSISYHHVSFVVVQLHCNLTIYLIYDVLDLTEFLKMAFHIAYIAIPWNQIRLRKWFRICCRTIRIQSYYFNSLWFCRCHWIHQDDNGTKSMIWQVVGNLNIKLTGKINKNTINTYHYHDEKYVWIQFKNNHFNYFPAMELFWTWCHNASAFFLSYFNNIWFCCWC